MNTEKLLTAKKLPPRYRIKGEDKVLGLLI